MDAQKVATFRERFTELVESSPKTRTTIAREFHVAKQTVSAWLTGQSSPRLPVIMSLADYFDVNFSWLLGFDVPKIVDRESYRKYEQYNPDAVQQDALGAITPDETGIILTYRALPDAGKQYIHQQLTAATLMFGEKSASLSVHSNIKEG